MKIKFRFVYFVLLLLSIIPSFCYASEKIPYKNENFTFSMYHYVLISKQKEYFDYSIDKDGSIIGKIRFVRYDKNGKKEVLSRNVPIDFLRKNFPENHKLIKLLNYNDFLDIPDYTSDKDIKTLTIFQAKYIYEGKDFNKNVKIYNINKLFSKGNNKDIIKLKFIMLYIESLEYKTYETDRILKQYGIKID